MKLEQVCGDGIVWRFIGLVGLVLGAYLQSRFSNSNDADAQLRLRRHEAYADYLEGVALASKKGSGNDSKLAIVRAKTRIAIYASSEAVSAIANLERVGPVLNSAAGQEAFIRVVRTMRYDGYGRAGTTENDSLLLLLFGFSG